MALARCETCGSPAGLKQTYNHAHAVISVERIFCGAAMCAKLAMVWLTDEEQQTYTQGVRVFHLSKRRVVVTVS